MMGLALFRESVARGEHRGTRRKAGDGRTNARRASSRRSAHRKAAPTTGDAAHIGLGRGCTIPSLPVGAAEVRPGSRPPTHAADGASAAPQSPRETDAVHPRARTGTHGHHGTAGGAGAALGMEGDGVALALVDPEASAARLARRRAADSSIR